MTECCYSLLNLQFSSFPVTDLGSNSFPQRFRKTLSFSHRSSKFLLSAISRTMEVVEGSEGSRGSSSPMKLLFVEMGVGYDQHGQDITVAAMRACKDAISSNSIPAFRRAFRSIEVNGPTSSKSSKGPKVVFNFEFSRNRLSKPFRRYLEKVLRDQSSIPGVSFDQMKLHIKLGVPHSLQKSLDVEKVKSVFPYGEILNVEVVDGGLICSSGVLVEEMGDKNDDCYIVNAAVYVGY